ncbi:PD40 domain-containing protein [candidate division WOR-3 bacterium]|nr:PD40 domain-containing protein [candidate division WOR-3 bacterium]
MSDARFSPDGKRIVFSVVCAGALAIDEIWMFEFAE